MTESARVSAKVRICQLSCADRAKHVLEMKPAKKNREERRRDYRHENVQRVAASLINIGDFLGYVMNSDEVLKMLSMAG